MRARRRGGCRADAIGSDCSAGRQHERPREPLLAGAHELIKQTLFEWHVQRNHAKPGARSVVRGSRGVHILGTETIADDSPVRMVARARH